MKISNEKRLWEILGNTLKTPPTCRNEKEAWVKYIEKCIHSDSGKNCFEVSSYETKSGNPEEIFFQKIRGGIRF